MIIFKEDTHQYFDNTGREYLPVTSLISKYKQPFNQDYWSKYKALEKYIKGKEGDYAWEYYKTQVKIDIDNFITRCKGKDEILQLQKEVIAEWEGIKDEACRIGTEFHKEQELKVLKDKGVIVKNAFFSIGSSESALTLEDGVYPELRVWHPDYLVCGTSDLVFKQDKYIFVDDYKTNKEISTKSYKDRKHGYTMMQYPLNNLMDCNYYHYALQISIYAFFLECFGYIVIEKELGFTHCILDREKTISVDGIEQENPDYGKVIKTKRYKIPYLRKEVISILELHKNGK